MGADTGTASYAHTAGHGCMRPDANVVANLNQVIELHTIFNDGILQCTSVNAGVGANFNIIANPDRSQLFDFFPHSLVRGKAKAIGPHHHTRVQNTPGPHHTPFRKGHP